MEYNLKRTFKKPCLITKGQYSSRLLLLCYSIEWDLLMKKFLWNTTETKPQLGAIFGTKTFIVILIRKRKFGLKTTLNLFSLTFVTN